MRAPVKTLSTPVMVLCRIIAYNRITNDRGALWAASPSTISDSLKSRLRVQAAVDGRSMEDEERDILRTVLSHEPRRPANLTAAIRARFAPPGGVVLPAMPRDAMLAPPTFNE
jgi:plasmid stability protein